MGGSFTLVLPRLSGLEGPRCFHSHSWCLLENDRKLGWILLLLYEVSGLSTGSLKQGSLTLCGVFQGFHQPTQRRSCQFFKGCPGRGRVSCLLWLKMLTGRPRFKGRRARLHLLVDGRSVKEFQPPQLGTIIWIAVTTRHLKGSIF